MACDTFGMMKYVKEALKSCFMEQNQKNILFMFCCVSWKIVMRGLIFVRI